jgi:hypothetical protein
MSRLVLAVSSVAPTLTAVEIHAGEASEFVYFSLPEATTVAIFAARSRSMTALVAALSLSQLL